MRRVRDPQVLASAFTRHGIATPHVVTCEQVGSRPHDVEQWMIKPRVSGGGHGVRRWRGDETVTRHQYLQEFVEGRSGSVVFVAAGGGGVALATSRQLVGEELFGASGFRYCGSILTRSDDETASAAIALVDALTAEVGLSGVGSIDFIDTDRGPRPVEVNPRWTASMELVERSRGTSMFGLHVDACTKGLLPPFDLRRQPAVSGAHGKAIVFAKEDLVAGNTRGWLEDPSVRDVPREGDHIAAGQPICTVFAVGADETACHAGLVDRAARVYADVEH